MSKGAFAAVGLFVFLVLAPRGWGAQIFIAHTNDLHSHMLGFAPNSDYTPQTVGDDQTLGGWSRIATLLKRFRGAHRDSSLILDAGDFLMGSLLHTISPQEGGELRAMGLMGYDVVTLGNHEFDLGPEGLAAILRAADSKGRIPKIVMSNIVFSPTEKGDDRLEEVFRETGVSPYVVVSRGGLRVGIMGLMGKAAAEVAPFSSPVRFSDPVETAKRTVDQMLSREKVDLVVALSHSGITDGGTGEDVRLAREVPGIDVIISGHTHTVLKEPVKVGDCVIVQAGSYGRYVGFLELKVKDQRIEEFSYTLQPVDDSIPGDASMDGFIAGLLRKVEKRFLCHHGIKLKDPLAEFDFPIRGGPWGESPLGNLISDAIRSAIDKVEGDPSDPGSMTRLTVESNGLIRDPLLPGRSGLLYISDLFRAFPLGFGPDGQMGYPLVSVYLYASEIKKALEVMTTIAPKKGTDYVLQVSGIKFNYNPNRVPFDRVTDIWMKGTEGDWQRLDTSAKNKMLYKVGANIYNATFLKIIGGFTYGILRIVPKDRKGRPLMNLRLALVDSDPHRHGIQELKEWRALLDYVLQFPDTDGDGIPNIPRSYMDVEGRILSQPSWDPYQLFRGASWITWVALSALLAGVALLGLLLWASMRLLLKRRGLGRG
jgi:5'-nucleotidase